FFFSSRRRHTRFSRDWSSDVCSSDLSQVTLVPQYILFKNFDWVGTMLPLIVPHFLAVSPFFVFLVVQFIRGIPKDLDESAKIDRSEERRVGKEWRCQCSTRH